MSCTVQVQVHTYIRTNIHEVPRLNWLHSIHHQAFIITRLRLPGKLKSPHFQLSRWRLSLQKYFPETSQAARKVATTPRQINCPTLWKRWTYIYQRRLPRSNISGCEEVMDTKAFQLCSLYDYILANDDTSGFEVMAPNSFRLSRFGISLISSISLGLERPGHQTISALLLERVYPRKR